MKKALFFVFLSGFLQAGPAFGIEAFDNVRPGDVVLFFGSPIGLFPETSPYSQPSLRVRKYHYLVHPIVMRLENGGSRGIASDDAKAELMTFPVYELSRYALWTEADMAEEGGN